MPCDAVVSARLHDASATIVCRVLKGQGSLDHFVKSLKPIMEPKLAKTRKRQAPKQSVCKLRDLLDIKSELGLASPVAGQDIAGR